MGAASRDEVVKDLWTTEGDVVDIREPRRSEDDWGERGAVRGRERTSNGQCGSTLHPDEWMQGPPGGPGGSGHLTAPSMPHPHTHPPTTDSGIHTHPVNRHSSVLVHLLGFLKLASHLHDPDFAHCVETYNMPTTPYLRCLPCNHNCLPYFWATLLKIPTRS